MAKKNKAYWVNRQEQWLTTQDKDDERISNRLEKDYQRTAKELEKDISTYFNRYGQDNVIEFRTMLQDLAEDDRNLLFQDMDRFAEKYPQYADLMPVRQSVYQLNRLEGLHYSTQMKLLELGAIEQTELEKHLEKTYGKHYKNMMKELGIGNQFLAIDDRTMRNTLFTGWVNGENFSDRIWANKEKMLDHMQTVYRDGLARGDNYAKLTKAIRERFDVGANDAKRLVWTESSFVLNQAHTQAYEQAGVEEYEISAIRDNKTSPICREMDGKVFRFDEMEVGLNFPPFHSYCRTTFLGILDGQAPREKNQEDDIESIVDQMDESLETNAKITDASISELKAKDNVIEELRKEMDEIKKQNNVKDKFYTAKEIDNMNIKELRNVAEKTAKEYYLSGKSGISFGDANIDDVVGSMVSQGNKTSLRKDIKSIQRKLKG